MTTPIKELREALENLPADAQHLRGMVEHDAPASDVDNQAAEIRQNVALLSAALDELERWRAEGKAFLPVARLTEENERLRTELEQVTTHRDALRDATALLVRVIERREYELETAAIAQARAALALVTDTETEGKDG